MFLKSPILFLIFNRPDTTKVVFESIRKVKPSRLYVASDGARSNNDDEDQKVIMAREIATAVDWDCDVKTLFRKDNLGLKSAVSNAIDWFFEQEEEGIILEDDCVPDSSFFFFCQETLMKYKKDTRIMAISGDNFQDGIRRTEKSYYFSCYPHCWGWATWKRAWKLYDGNLSDWQEVKAKGLIGSIGGDNRTFVAYWSKIFDQCYSGKIDSWAYPWTYSCWLQSGLTILPSVNLVTNIGFGENATHTKGHNSRSADFSASGIQLPLSHPAYVIRDAIADRYTDTNHFGLVDPLQSVICKMIKKLQQKVCP